MKQIGLSPKRRAKLFKFFHSKNLPYLPATLGMETGNICNLKCPLCPTGMGDQSMKKGFLESSLFKKIVDQLRDSLKVINLYSWGEPLLNPDLIKMIRYAKELRPDARIITSTNLNINNDLLLEELLRSGIDEIIISCDGVSQDSYSKYRVGGDFDLVMRNMKHLIYLEKRLNAKTYLVWNFLVFKHNEKEVEEAKKMAAALGIDLRIAKMRTAMKDEILRPHGESIRKYKEWIPEKEEYSAYDKVRGQTRIKIKSCRKPWQEISINWNGEVFPCCAVYGDEYSLGNAKKESVKEIWNNESYLGARREILDKRCIAKSICGICRDNGFMHM